MIRTIVALALAAVAALAQDPPAIDAATRAALANRVEGRHTGKVTALVLHQNGVDQRAPKTDR